MQGLAAQMEKAKLQAQRGRRQVEGKADNALVWRAGELRSLWQCPHLTTLHAIWELDRIDRMARRSPLPSPARVVPARIFCGMRRLIMRLGFRVDMRLSDLGACPHCLARRNPSLTLDRIKEWWWPPGPLCRLHAGAAGCRAALAAVVGDAQPCAACSGGTACLSTTGSTARSPSVCSAPLCFRCRLAAAGVARQWLRR